MRDADVRMVMRSVYLPEDMDEGLRGAAFKLRISKSQLIRQFVHAGLEQVSQRLNAERARREDIAKTSAPERNAARWVEAGSVAGAMAAAEAGKASQETAPNEEASPEPRFMAGY